MRNQVVRNQPASSKDNQSGYEPTNQPGRRGLRSLLAKLQRQGSSQT